MPVKTSCERLDELHRAETWRHDVVLAGKGSNDWALARVEGCEDLGKFISGKTLGGPQDPPA